MSDRVLYLLAVVAIGWGVTFGLRSLPFLLFAGRDRALPPWVERLGNVISPVIIGGLIVYSYSGLEWRTLWPYLAGALTVGLQLWKRNPLASIVAGTVVYMCLLNCGCSTARAVNIDARDPSIEVRKSGIYVGEDRVEVADVPDLLDDAEIPKTRAIHILLDGDVKNLTEARTLMGVLAMSGYTRSVLVTKQHGDSVNKSGATYADEELVRHGDDAFFMVTREGVRFGLLTPVDPDKVVKCLRDNRVQRGQPVRICGQAQDYQSPEVMGKMLQLEKILRDAGYDNVKRFWLESAKAKGEARQAGAAARPSAGDKRTIRYKGANE